MPHFAIVRASDCSPLGAFELDDGDYGLGSIAEVAGEVVRVVDRIDAVDLEHGFAVLVVEPVE